MKPFLTLILITLVVNFSFCQYYTSYSEYDEHIWGSWEGTLSGGGLETKKLTVVFTYSEYNSYSDEDGGWVEGYSTVNNGNKTVFNGSYIVDADIPFLELSEPETNPTNGTFNISLRCETDDGFQDYCCGEWTSYNKKIKRNIRLEKIKGNTGTFEVIQSENMDNVYFKTMISKRNDILNPNDENFWLDVMKVNVMEKNTDRLLQTMELEECGYFGRDQVSIGDYNFDGLPDFSVFQQVPPTGPMDTYRIYFLFDPVKKQYYNSGFSGGQLDFDDDQKIITKREQIDNEKMMTSIYNVVNNQMVLVEEHCFVWDDNKGDFIERDIKFCE